MRRHNPTLFTHLESSDPQDDWGSMPRFPLGFSSTPHAPNTTAKSRVKLRQRTSASSSSSTSSATTPAETQQGNYSNIYNQFLRRYRAEPGDDDPRNDPDSHYFQRGLGQLVDAGDSDEDDITHGLTGDLDRVSLLMLDSEPIEPETVQDRERLEWQTMLASVLSGDVLKSEKFRIATALETSGDEQSHLHSNIWLGLRAKLRGRSEEEERKSLEERRLRIVDPVINEILTFRVNTGDASEDPHSNALKQVNAALHHLDVAISLYPCIKAFLVEKPAAQSNEFQARCDTLNSWSTLLTALRHELDLLRRWTGSDTLDVTEAITESDDGISNGNQQLGGKNPDATTFIDRLLKEENVQREFEKGSMTTIHALVGTARDTQVNLSHLFRQMNLPTLEKVLVPLVSFATNLAQSLLRVRLNYAQKLKDPEVLIIDQMSEDIKVKIGFACTLKRHYEAFLAPDPGGNWNLPPCISADYDRVILEALAFFFKLIHWKLKSGVKAIYFKETDVIEAQWATFNDVGLTVVGGTSVVAEQLCALTNKLMVRVTNYFDTQIRIPSGGGKAFGRKNGFRDHAPSSPSQYKSNSTSEQKMSDEQMVSWYRKILESVRIRYRKLQRFARALTQRFSNSAEYTLEDVPVEHLIAAFVETDHFLVYTQTFEEDGVYIVAPPSLRDHPAAISRILMEAFHINESDEEVNILEAKDDDNEPTEFVDYLLVLSPRTQFLWNGLVYMLELPKIDLDLKDNRLRLIADGSQGRLAAAKRELAEIFMPVDEDGELLEVPMGQLTCITEQQSHLPNVNNELRKITRATNRLAQSIVDSVHHVRAALKNVRGCQELLENWYLFASEHGQHVQKYMDMATLVKFNQMLIRLAISWVAFICDDCDPDDQMTFKWAVNALEFTLHRTKWNNILQIPDDQFEMLRQKVASCMTLLISHFDILGARSIQEANKERERQQEIRQHQASSARMDEEDNNFFDTTSSEDAFATFIDPAVRMFWEKTSKGVKILEVQRTEFVSKTTVGRVLDEEKLVDRSLVSLAGSSSNVSIRWQQGRFIGAGSFGSVYLAVNLETGSLMAVKEIKYTELAGLPNLYSQIKEELNVMEMLHHPNVVEYYGIEVHRDKVYIFEEYCQGGSLASLLEHGRIEDEGLIQVYTMQMLEGLAYLHSKGVVHRDVKPDNILLDHMGVIKFVDFGAAKILAKNQRSIQRSRRLSDSISTLGQLGGGLGMNNSLTGTPMYMSPEIIRNNKRGRQGAMDIWSMGCVVLECATGKKPWSNLDNEWAIMFHIGVATQHPPLPEPGQLSEEGINFIKQCLTIDPMLRPPATELIDQPWMLDFREALLSYEEVEMQTSPPVHVEDGFEAASVARQAAIMREKEVQAIRSSSPALSPTDIMSPRQSSLREISQVRI